MANLNSVQLIGNLTRPPEIRYTPKGTAIAGFGLAVNRRWNNEAGETQEEVTFVDIEAFARVAELCGEYLDKGSSVFIQGRLKLDSWDCKETGQKRSKMKVIVESLQFLDRKPAADTEAPPRAAAARPAARGAAPARSLLPTRPAAARPPQRDPDLDAEESSDIPF